MQCDAIKEWMRSQGVSQARVAREARVIEFYVMGVLNGLDKVRCALAVLGCPEALLGPVANEAAAGGRASAGPDTAQVADKAAVVFIDECACPPSPFETAMAAAPQEDGDLFLDPSHAQMTPLG